MKRGGLGRRRDIMGEAQSSWRTEILLLSRLTHGGQGGAASV